MNVKSEAIQVAHMIQKNIMVILACSIGILTVLSSVRFLKDANYWLVDLFSHFPVQYGIVAIGLFGVCLWKKTVFLGSLTVLLAVVNLSVFAQYSPLSSPLNASDHMFTIYLANVWRSNADIRAMYQEILRLQAACVFLMEVTPQHMQPLQPLLEEFPYRIEQPRDDFSGFVFLSRHLINNYQIITNKDHGTRPLLTAKILVGQTPVHFYGIHPHTPVWRPKFHQRNAQLRWLADDIADRSQPVIVAGDLNTTPFSPTFRELLIHAGLQDTRRGAGWNPSWPVYMPIFWLPIDHILVSSDIQVCRLSTGKSIGSDHYPLIAEIRMSSARDEAEDD